MIWQKIKNNIVNQEKSGFVMLFAVTLSSILLSVALGVSNITFRELSFTTSARDATNAFLAADTAAECALFHDKLASSSFPIGGPATPISCASNTITPTFSGDADTASYDFVLYGVGSEGSSCAKVNVYKDRTQTPILVQITSTGYNVGDLECNSTSSRRVEREIIVSSEVGTPPVYTPPPSNVDLKCDGGDTCSLAYGGSATLSWTTSASITSCVASGDWSGNKSWPNGSESTGSLTASKIYTLTCDGLEGQAQDSVTVTVAPGSHLVTTSPGPNGLVDPNSPTITHGNQATITLIPNSGYSASASGCGGSQSGNSYVTGAITAPCTVSVTFSQNQYTVDALASAGGSISPSSRTVSHGGTTTFTVTPNAGYVASASGCGGSLSGTTYTTGSITSNCTVSASFAQCNITGGTITNSGGYRYHTFTNSGTFSTNCAKNIDYLLVAGGGGGGVGSEYYGNVLAGGGGGGGGVWLSSTSLSAGNYSVVVGAGGTGNNNGGNSSIPGFEVVGGGRGGRADAEECGSGCMPGQVGGSGGGGSGNGGGSQPAGGAGFSGQGNAGGVGGAYSGGAGGGGGAGGVGGAGGWGDPSAGGIGGAGKIISFPSAYTYSPGGYGGQHTYTVSGYGAGGRGGEGNYRNPTSGQNGIVIIRYVP